MARKSRLKTRSSTRRWPLVVGTLLLLGGIAAAGWFKYQEQLENLAEVWRETFDVKEPVAADELRGTIFDRNFKELAQTLERVSLYVRPREVTNLEKSAEQLAKILGSPEAEIRESLEEDSHLVWLRRDIAQADEELVTELNLPGIYFHREFARSYPEQEKASHLIGYSENDRGLAGVEHYYDRLLNHGSIKQLELQEIDLGGLEQTSPYGHDLVLTLDMKIQSILENYVSGLGEKLGDIQIASLLLNPADGSIIAGANYPGYNLNNVWQHEHKVLDSLLFTPMVLPPEIRGFFRMAAQLQGGWEQSRQIFPWAIVPQKMDFARQIRLWDRVQLSTEMHVDFSSGRKKATVIPQFMSCGPEEDYGTVPKAVSPLKVLLGMTHLLNGGKTIQPHILNRIVERSSQKEFYYNHAMVNDGRKVYPSLASKELRTYLCSVGTDEVLGAKIVGGESTSLIADYSGGQYVRDALSLVVVTGVKPELVLLLASRQEKAGAADRSVQKPGFLTRGLGELLPSMVALQQVNQNLSDMMELPEQQEKNFNRKERSEDGQISGLAEVLDSHTVHMPSLVGMSLRKGLRILQRTAVKVEAKGSGRIVKQSPPPGTPLEKGAVVQLELEPDSPPGNNKQ